MSESLSVLLVEDDPIQRSLAHRILSLEARLSVFTAADGLEGLAFALQHHPQVILLDLILPGISGLELLRRYRDQGGTAKVLALSQAPGQWVCDAALAAGADFFFPKPVHWGEVLRLLLFLCDDLTSRCRALLLKLGAPADWAGFSQTALAAGLLAGRLPRRRGGQHPPSDFPSLPKGRPAPAGAFPSAGPSTLQQRLFADNGPSRHVSLVIGQVLSLSWCHRMRNRKD